MLTVAADSLPVVLAGWALVAVFLAVPLVLYAGRHDHGRVGRLRRLIAKPPPAEPASSSEPSVPAGTPAPSETAGLPAATDAPDDNGGATGAPPPRPPGYTPPPSALEPFPLWGEFVPPEVATPPAWPGSRVSSETLAPLADYVDRSRRLVICEHRVALKLAELPRDRWLVERYVLVGGLRIPFLVLGEAGVFNIWPLDGAHAHRDPELFDEMAGIIQKALPGYPGQVWAGICRPMDPDLQPRWWFSPQGKSGGWVMGSKWLIRWLEHFGTEHGLGVKDVESFDQLAGPHWERRPVGAPIPNQPPAG